MSGDLESDQLHAANQASVCTLKVDDAGELVQACPRRRSIGEAFLEDKALPAIRSGRASLNKAVSDLQDWWNRTEFWTQDERNLGEDVKDDIGSLGQFFSPITLYKTVMRQADKHLAEPAEPAEPSGNP